MSLRRDINGNMYSFPEPDGAAQVVAIGAGSLASAAFGANTKVVILSATAGAWIAYGAAPTAAAATAGNFYLPPNYVVVMCVLAGNKFAAIQSVGAGTLSIQECT